MPEYTSVCLNKQCALINIAINKDSQHFLSSKYAKILNMGRFSICEHYTAFWKYQNMTWQSSEYILGSKYARIANMTGF